MLNEFEVLMIKVEAIKAENGIIANKIALSDLVNKIVLSDLSKNAEIGELSASTDLHTLYKQIQQCDKERKKLVYTVEK
jgi:hypothetical protein